MNTSQSTTPVAGTPKTPNSSRKKALTFISIVVLIGLAYGGYEWLIGRHREVTDNAYVQANVIQVTPQIGGTVISVSADDTDYVQAGQVLVQLDPSDAKTALEQAQANLAQVVRQVKSMYSNNDTLKAQLLVRQADVAKAQNEVVRAQDDVNRRQALVASGAVSKEELSHTISLLNNAKNNWTAAQAAVSAARQQINSSQSMTEGTNLQNHPQVLIAAAKLKEAYLAMKRTTITAPTNGYVAKRSIQIGQRVPAGVPLMAVIPLQDVWVDANFKEVQLRQIRVGQPAALVADVYGNKVEFKGTVLGLGAGTGAAFSLLPAQNATGNWIKVVQRVPVRIALDPEQLAQHPLRVGLSMEAIVDVSNSSGVPLAAGATDPKINASKLAKVNQMQQANEQQVMQLEAQADQEVQKIIAAHSGNKRAISAVQ